LEAGSTGFLATGQTGDHPVVVHKILQAALAVHVQAGQDLSNAVPGVVVVKAGVASLGCHIGLETELRTTNEKFTCRSESSNISLVVLDVGVTTVEALYRYQ
jgi:hypothetical protein